MLSLGCSSTRIKLLYVENDPFWSSYVARLVSGWPEFQLMGTAATGADAVKYCCKAEPDVLLLDIQLPDMNGFSTLSLINAEGRLPPALLLSCRKDDFALHHASSPLVSGMILKSTDFDGWLHAALSAVAAGRRFYSPEVQAAITKYKSEPEAFHKILSDREQQLLRLVASGCSEVEIAASLGITRATAHAHR